MSYNLGLCSVSFRGHTPIEILKNMQKLGLSVIEWGSDVHCPPQNAKNIAALQKEYGIKCSSYGTYFRLGSSPVEELEIYANAAKVLGTNILRVWCGNKNSQDFSTDEREQLFAECRKAASVAEQNGVILCMECHNGTYTNKKEAAFELMREVNSKHFRMYWQPNQFETEQENIEYAKLIAPYTEHIHVFNWRKDENLPLRDGKDIWKKYLGCFEKNKTLLLEFMPDGRLETLENEALALKEIVK